MKKQKQTREELERDKNDWKRLTILYFIMTIVLLTVLLIVLSSFFIKILNLQQENEMLKSQITTWNLKINCSLDSNIAELDGNVNFNIRTTNRSSYENIKEMKDDVTTSLEENGFKDCEMLN